MEKQEESRKKITGGRNLMLLGVISILVAVVTTGISLLVYHNSGDIYLDRSRPGFLPDEGEIEDEQVDPGYDYAKEGELTVSGLDKYLEEMSVELKNLDNYAEAFSEEGLSDKSLGIPAESESK